MKIYNLDKTQILNEDSINLNLGYLKDDQIVIGETKTSIVTEKISEGTKTIVTPGELIYEKIKIYVLFSPEELIKNQISDIENWFETEYREKLEEYSRKVAIGTMLSDGTNPAIKLNDLYSEAEAKANQLDTLKKQCSV